MARRAGRQRNQLPTCYYEGYLEKRSFNDKVSRKLWTCLCGSTLFFFNDKRDADYAEKLDLGGFISISEDSSSDRNLDASRLNLQMKDEHIKLTAPNAETRELWKGFIYSVSQLSVPPCLNLLPGQIHMLKEAIEAEKERVKTKPAPPVANSSTYISLQADMPACYHNVSRLEAELLLEREAKRGNMLLRPGRSGHSFSISTRQEHDGSIFKHYRVSRRHDGGFNIEVDNPVPCATLHDVIDFLVESTCGVLIPLIIEEPYEKSISFFQSDKENGEISIQKAVSNVVPPSVPPKPVALRIPTSEPVQVKEDSFDQTDTSEETENNTEDSSAVPASKVEKKSPKTAMMPPNAPPRKLTLTTPAPSTNSSTNKEPKMITHAGIQRQIPLAAITELKLKLEKKSKSQEEPFLV